MGLSEMKMRTAIFACKWPFIIGCIWLFCIWLVIKKMALIVVLSNESLGAMLLSKGVNALNGWFVLLFFLFLVGGGLGAVTASRTWFVRCQHCHSWNSSVTGTTSERIPKLICYDIVDMDIDIVKRRCNNCGFEWQY